MEEGILEEQEGSEDTVFSANSARGGEFQTAHLELTKLDRTGFNN
jgi:hypothetical protein